MLLLNRASFKNTVRSVRNKAYRFLQLCDISLDKLTTTVLSISMKGVIERHTVDLKKGRITAKKHSITRISKSMATAGNGKSR